MARLKLRPARSKPQSSKRDFKTILDETTRDMSRPRLLFSKFIHISSINSIANLLATTIARPNSLLYGGIASFLVAVSTYLIAKNLGYSLSGFESIGAFALGWLVGVLVDISQRIMQDS